MAQNNTNHQAKDRKWLRYTLKALLYIGLAALILSSDIPNPASDIAFLCSLPLIALSGILLSRLQRAQESCPTGESGHSKA